MKKSPVPSDNDFSTFMLNHWPHMVSRVARIEGILFVGGSIVIALLGTIVAKL